MSGGDVGVPDITPIAQNYLETVDYTTDGEDNKIPTGDITTLDGMRNHYLAWIDGDKNGEVGISDITPIAENYLNEVVEYAVYGAGNPDIPLDDWLEIGRVTFQEARDQLTSEAYFPISFSFDITTYSFNYYLVRPFDSRNEAGVESNIVAKTNNPPNAHLSADVTSGEVPLTVLFDASSSTDEDGQIVRYNWDFDGDGTVDRSSTDPVQEFTFETGRRFNSAVSVVDDDGLSSIASLTIDATVGGNLPPTPSLTFSPEDPHAPVIIQFDASGSVDHDGNIVSFEWDFDDDGTYELSTGATPNTERRFVGWKAYPVALKLTDNDSGVSVLKIAVTIGEPEVVEMEIPFEHADLGAVTLSLDSDNNPHILTYEFDHEILFGLWHLFYDGNSWNYELVDPDGQWNSQIYQDGLLHVSYFYDLDSAKSILKYGVWDGTEWSISELTYPETGISDTSIKVDSMGNPFIATHLYDDPSDEIIRLFSYNGSSWDSDLVYDTMNTIGIINLNLDASDNPYIVFSEYSSPNKLMISYYDTEWASEILEEDSRLVDTCVDNVDSIRVLFRNYSIDPKVIHEGSYKYGTWTSDGILQVPLDAGILNASIDTDSVGFSHVIYQSRSSSSDPLIANIWYAVNDGNEWFQKPLYNWQNADYSDVCIKIGSDDKPRFYYESVISISVHDALFYAYAE
jgi:PKD repeat protein